ncbi:MAG TPA: helix-turn-helix domain-containing protein [Mucilaginibacter sp.]|nr:helix-turn-helix domain-containing protein [Mucilaginibacter sp.]
MDGYTLAAQLRRTRRRYRLSATSQALFYELVSLANEEGWPAIFSCSNGELISALGVSENTMISARQELIRAGLIHYKSLRNKRTFSEYQLVSTSKFDVKTDANPDAKVDVKADDYNKLKEKPKLKKVEEVVTCDAAFEFFKSTKNKRLLVEKHALTDNELEYYFLVFYDSKVDLGDLNGKSLTEIAKNFYYWMPKHLLAQRDIRNTSDVIRNESNQPNVKRTTSNVQPTRGVAAALQFTDVVMRE